MQKKNSWNAQGTLENDDCKDNINLTHKGVTKNVDSATTVKVSDKKFTTVIIINLRAYQGDIVMCIFKMSEYYLASANSDGKVGKIKIFVCVRNDQSVATNQNGSSWFIIKDGSLEADTTLTKVYNGFVNFRFIKLELNSRGKPYNQISIFFVISNKHFMFFKKISK